MREVTPPEASRPPDGPSSEMANFLRAFGSRRVSSLPSTQDTYALEALLARIEGIHSARIETTETGEIRCIHVVAEGGVAPSEQMRRIRSALLAAHGLDIDPRLISLVPLKEVASREEISRPRPGELRARLGQISYQQEGFRVVAYVELEWQGKTVQGLSREADTPKGRAMASARAALRAVEAALEQGVGLSLEALDTLRAFERNITVASVRLVSGRHRAALVGCASTLEDPNHAAAQAVLAAVNRYVGRLVERVSSLQRGDHRPERSTFQMEDRRRLAAPNGP